VNLLSKEGIIELYKKYSKDLEVITCLNKWYAEKTGEYQYNPTLWLQRIK